MKRSLNGLLSSEGSSEEKQESHEKAKIEAPDCKKQHAKPGTTNAKKEGSQARAEDEESKVAEPPQHQYVFGSGFTGATFTTLATSSTASTLAKATATTSFLDEQSNQSKEIHQSDGDDDDDAITSPLKLQEIKTGEEDEQTLLQLRCKLFVMPIGSATWKERGVGALHVNQSRKEKSSSRLIMRTDGTLKLVLNAPILPNMDVAVVQDKNVRMTAAVTEGEQGASEEGKPGLLLFRFKQAADANQLFDKLTMLMKNKK